jgi:NADPH2:quinone reductase
MKAVGYFVPADNETPVSLVDLEVDKPQLTKPHDLLIQVKAVSVNPVDYKIRNSSKTQSESPKILGWDASGIVLEVGNNVSRFRPGDEVYYAGEITRSGTNAEFHLVDERIVGKKPTSLSFESAAALPLTSLTAYEVLFERLEVQRDSQSETILIIGAAGGVGSIAIQMIKALTHHKVIATASRQETTHWCKQMGADFVIDHTSNFSVQFKKLGLGNPKYVISLNHTENYLQQIAEVIRPQGKFCLIDDPSTLDIGIFKKKSVSVHWELMFTRSLFQTDDMTHQGKILDEVAQLLDEKKLVPTSTRSLGVLNAANLRIAHEILEKGCAIGKITLVNQ